MSFDATKTAYGIKTAVKKIPYKKDRSLVASSIMAIAKRLAIEQTANDSGFEARYSIGFSGNYKLQQ